MPGQQDLYIDYLQAVHRDELRLMARNQNIAGYSHMDKPELIVKLLDVKISRAEAYVVSQARSWRLGEPNNDHQLKQAIDELESLHEARKEWEQKWATRLNQST